MMNHIVDQPFYSDGVIRQGKIRLIETLCTLNTQCTHTHTHTHTHIQHCKWNGANGIL